LIDACAGAIIVEIPVMKNTKHEENVEKFQRLSYSLMTSSKLDTDEYHFSL
jgi:hypothetical protein